MLDHEKVRQLLALDDLLHQLEHYGLQYGQRGNRCRMTIEDQDMKKIICILRQRYERLFESLKATQ